MANRLSFSAITKFKYCPQAWKWHYVERYRPIQVSSALLFGSAIGKSFEQLILTKDLENAKALFLSLWTEQEINGKLEKIKEYPHIHYFKSDMDKDLGNTPWDTLLVKGNLILDSFYNNLLPLIEHVYSTEEKVELSSGEDVSIGFADAVVKIKGYDKPIILDFKTASRPYEADSVQKSEQLSHYMHSLADKYGTRLAGYAVFLKDIKKNKTKVCSKCGYEGTGTNFKTCNNEKRGARCNSAWIVTLHPECEMQLIVDEITEDHELSVIDEIGTINDLINENRIEKNLEVCDNNYGRSCEFINLCHKGDPTGLIKLDKKV